MRHDVVIHESDAARIDVVLTRFLAESGASAALLIDRSGQPLAQCGTSPAPDTASMGALAAGAFSATAALARLLGESEFSVLFHEGKHESLHVSTVDDFTILLAVFGDHTTVGMVRLFARETSASIGVILQETRTRPRRTGVLAAPLTADEAGRAVDHRPAERAALAPATRARRGGGGLLPAGVAARGRHPVRGYCPTPGVHRRATLMRGRRPRCRC
jgi:predicted regulator of Ras-like GTPase activity (Roadblock/LC7/MglB family)